MRKIQPRKRGASYFLLVFAKYMHLELNQKVVLVLAIYYYWGMLVFKIYSRMQHLSLEIRKL
jgi:hypothetical protein